MLEAMARTAAQEQHVGPIRVQVDQEIAVRAVLILADLGPDQRCIAEGREAAVAEFYDFGERSVCRATALRIGINFGAVLVVGELDAASLEIGEAVENVAAVEVGPSGHRARQEAAVAGRRREIEDLLPRGQDSRADD